jgi:hypothetical protein
MEETFPEWKRAQVLLRTLGKLRTPVVPANCWATEWVCE